MGGRDGAICRELTKMHEEVKRGPLTELAQAADTLETRGEFVLLIEGRSGQRPEQPTPIDTVTRRWLEALSTELPASKLAAIAARVSGLPRAALYRSLAYGLILLAQTLGWVR